MMQEISDKNGYKFHHVHCNKIPHFMGLTSLFMKVFQIYQKWPLKQ